MCWICNGINRDQLNSTVDMLEKRVDYWGKKILYLEDLVVKNENTKDVSLEDIKKINIQLDKIYERLDVLRIHGK